MKKFNISIAGILIMLMVITVSCKKWIDPEINVDPNQPADVSLNTLLPAAEMGMGYALGGDLKYAASIWMQQMAGGANQPLAYDRYVFTQSDVDNVWKWNLYAGPMMDCKVMMDKAAETGNPYYNGMAKVMMANMLGCITDLWGSAPYSEAFQGNENLKPAFDSQQDLYATINTLLDGAISDFNQAETANKNLPSYDDLIYGGDVTLWKQAAYAFKARYALHLSKVNGASAYTNALSALSGAMTSNSEDFELYFGNATNENNPLFQFNDQRPYDIVVGYYLVNEMQSTLPTADPRLPLLVDPTDGIVGSHAGEGEAASLIGPYYASPNSPVPFISYVECKFIEAECLLEGGNPGGAATAYNDGVKASLAKMGVTDVAWEAVNANETDLTITKEKIIKGKYFALCYQLEVFNDWRRTGYPALTPAASGVLGGVIPRHYPYPTSEKQYNSANTPDVSLTTRVWWDI